MTRWHWLVFNDAKSHACPEELRAPLVAEMKRRGCSAVPGKSKQTSLIVFDQPGAIITTMPQETVVVGGLSIRLWADEVPGTRTDLTRLPVRTFKGGAAYRKLHGYARCLVLTPSLWAEAIEKLGAVADDCERRVKEFYERWRMKPALAESRPAETTATRWLEDVIATQKERA